MHIFLVQPYLFLSPCNNAGLSVSSSNSEGLRRALVVYASLYAVSLDLRRSSLTIIGSEVSDVIEVIRRYLSSDLKFSGTISAASHRFTM
ncbi:hypothetical protein TIFTF001_009588 [Ficus carica]|uniref:Uncharacterized protein n=1 Tax=Ficus carica TaxID=3494 RepID=A0AA88D3Q7_FICCA|nr:hypothetical protein TIFTF001_009588 [Ficus carica]